MTVYVPALRSDGSLLPSSVPKRTSQLSRDSAGGLLLRGVVIRTGGYWRPDTAPPGTVDQGGVYCDAFIYSSKPGAHLGVLRNILVPQPGSTPEGGRRWLPKAATGFIGPVTELFDENNLSKHLAYVNGEHILIGFIDDSPTLPVALATLPHPSADIGNASNIDPTDRQRPSPGDAHVRPELFHGTSHGVKEDGSFYINTAKAFKSLLPDGTRPPAPLDGSVGNVPITLPVGSGLTVTFLDPNPTPTVLSTIVTIQHGQVHVQLSNGESLVITGNGAMAALTLGDGARSAVVAEELLTVFNEIATKLSSHTHLVVGAVPSGANPVTAEAPLTIQPVSTWPAGATSSKLKIPG